MTEFNAFPSCGRNVGPRAPISRGILTTCECKKDGAVYCGPCGGDRCPVCGQADRKKVGFVPWR